MFWLLCFYISMTGRSRSERWWRWQGRTCISL